MHWATGAHQRTLTKKYKKRKADRERRRATRIPGKRGRPKSKESEEKALVYANAVLVEGKTKTEAKEIAGYSENFYPERLEHVRNALVTVGQRREELQNTPGFTLTDIATRFKNRATDPKVSPRDQTVNDKALVEVLDYTPEKKVNVTNVGLLMEFTDLTSEDLKAARDKILRDAGAHE